MDAGEGDDRLRAVPFKSVMGGGTEKKIKNRLWQVWGLCLMFAVLTVSHGQLSTYSRTGPRW